MRTFRYATADVFAAAPLTGNPVAVVLNAAGLSSAQMQALAVEFNYVETTFVLPAADPQHTARVRIFTPDREVPFAGHPNIGTAFLLAQAEITGGGQAPRRFSFEEEAGLVSVDLLYEEGRLVGAQLLAPQPLSVGAPTDAASAAACLGLSPDDVSSLVHAPQVASVGLPFLLVELASREALARVRPDRDAYDRLFPLDGARAVYAYCRSAPGAVDAELHARMFTWRLVEDPATGSAAGALAAFLAARRGEPMSLRVWQGEDMGRPSRLTVRGMTDGSEPRAIIEGHCSAMFQGSFVLPV